MAEKEQETIQTSLPHPLYQLTQSGFVLVMSWYTDLLASINRGAPTLRTRNISTVFAKPHTLVYCIHRVCFTQRISFYSGAFQQYDTIRGIQVHIFISPHLHLKLCCTRWSLAFRSAIITLWGSTIDFYRTTCRSPRRLLSFHHDQYVAPDQYHNASPLTLLILHLLPFAVFEQAYMQLACDHFL